MFCVSFVSATFAESMSGGNVAIEEESTRDVLVRSEASRRAFAVATRDWIGGGGERDVVRVVRRVWEGGGRERERMEWRSWDMRSICAGDFI